MDKENDSPKPERLVSLDAYRGLVMFTLAATGFGIARAADKADCELLDWLKFQFTHPEWSSQFKLIGFSLWDMIQPAFMFMVGVSMPYSYARRELRGDSYASRLRHAWTRAILLVLLGVFLQSQHNPDTNWIFTNVLSQIGLGYGFLFFLVGRKFRTQAVVGAVVLVGYWILMAVFPRGLDGLAAHFADGSSMPQQVDLWLLNLFPRSKPFTGLPYATLNFVPAFVTMLMGLVCGQLLKNPALPSSAKLRRLAAGGAVCLAAAVVASLTVCPVVKKLWTPSWALFSGAYVIWLLAILYWLVDVKGWKKWTFPFVVVGLNPITIYFMSMTMKRWVGDNLKTHLPAALFEGVPGPIVESCLIVTVYWLILYWMYRKKVFIRI